MKKIKARDLNLNQYFLLIEEDKAGIFKITERHQKYPNEIRAHEISLADEAREVPRVSKSVVVLRPNEKVMLLRGIGEAIA